MTVLSFYLSGLLLNWSNQESLSSDYSLEFKLDSSFNVLFILIIVVMQVESSTLFIETVLFCRLLWLFVPESHKNTVTDTVLKIRIRGHVQW